MTTKFTDLDLPRVLMSLGYSLDQFNVWDDGDGQYIKEWSGGSPQPTDEQITDQWALLQDEAAQNELPTAKIAANNEIDVYAEMARSKYITTGSGQAMTYQEKGEEAADYAAAGYPAIGSPVDYPFIHADALAFNITHQQAADIILAQRAAWVAIGAAIERIRLGGKNSIASAANVSEVNTIKNNTIASLMAI